MTGDREWGTYFGTSLWCLRSFTRTLLDLLKYYRSESGTGAHDLTLTHLHHPHLVTKLNTCNPTSGESGRGKKVWLPHILVVISGEQLHDVLNSMHTIKDRTVVVL